MAMTPGPTKRTLQLMEVVRRKSRKAWSMTQLARDLGVSRVYLYQLAWSMPDGDEIIARVAANKDRAAAEKLAPLLRQLREARKEQGLSIQELTGQLGWKPWQLRNFERMSNKAPLLMVVPWAEALGLELVLRRPRSTRGGPL